MLPLFRCVMIDFSGSGSSGDPGGAEEQGSFCGGESPGSTEYSENIRRARYTLSVYENMYLLYIDRLTVKF